jgi:hypothetical protein
MEQRADVQQYLSVDVGSHILCSNAYVMRVNVELMNADVSVGS